MKRIKRKSPQRREKSYNADPNVPGMPDVPPAPIHATLEDVRRAIRAAEREHELTKWRDW